MEYDFILSGPISGNERYRVEFALASGMLRQKVPGAKVWNPAMLEEGRDYKWYMRKCVAAIMDEAKPTCVHVRMKGWNRSLGSVAEWALCRCLGMPSVGLEEVTG